MRIQERRWFVPLILFAIVAGFYWKLVFTNQYEWISSPDLATQVMPWFEVQARQWHEGKFPLWDPSLWNGEPLLGQAQPGAAYPLNWPLFWMPLRAGAIRIEFLQWYFVLTRYLAALFAYLLCRDIGCSRTGSLVGGLLFALSGFIGTTMWPQMVNGAIWAPLIVMFLLRVCRGAQPLASSALAGLFLGISWLSGHHQIPIYLTLTSAGLWIFFLTRGAQPVRSLLLWGAVFLLIFLLVGAFQILPAEEYGKLAKRWVGSLEPLRWDQKVPYVVHRMYALYFSSLLSIVFPGLNRNSDPFLGVAGVSLALLGMTLRWRVLWVRVFAAIALCGVIYALGHNSVFHGIIYALLPSVNKARVPSMAMLVFQLGAGVLAAFGVDAMSSGDPSPWKRRITNGTAVFGVFVFAAFTAVVLSQKLEFSSDDRVLGAGLTALLLAGLLYAWRTGNLTARQAPALLVLLVLFELGNDSGYTFTPHEDLEGMKPISAMRGNLDIAAFLHAQPGPFRIQFPGEELPANWASWHGLEALGGSGASIALNTLDSDHGSWQSNMLWGGKYTIARKPPLDSSKEVFRGASGLIVYENPPARPRAWATHEVIHVSSAAEGRQIVADRLSELDRKVFTAEPLAAGAPCSAPDRIEVSRHDADFVEIKAVMGCPGMVVLSDSFYPGWRAAVDGRAVPIHQVDASLRGTDVPLGAHAIEYRYRPRSVFAGAGLSALGALLAAALIFFERKRGKRIDLPVLTRNNTN